MKTEIKTPPKVSPPAKDIISMMENIPYRDGITKASMLPNTHAIRPIIAN